MSIVATQPVYLKSDHRLDIEVDERGIAHLTRTFIDHYDNGETQVSDTDRITRLGHIDYLNKWDVPPDLADRLSELQHAFWKGGK